MSRVSLFIRLVLALCLLAATFNHLRAALDHGLLWDYGYGVDTPLASRAFWGSLTLFDPLAALLLFVRPRWGLLLTLAIIVLDVVHNSFYVAATASGWKPSTCLRWGFCWRWSRFCPWPGAGCRPGGELWR